MTITEFRKVMWTHARKHGRDALPWRMKSATPYAILVSEVMLQQTQVDRVIPYYRAWLKRFPTVRALADAPLSEVLAAWQGLGYNRRAKMLHDAARAVMRDHEGKMPRTVEELEGLPGVGPYTARAVAAFAYNADTVFVETNLRTAVAHHFYDDAEKVTDREILSILEKALPKGRAKEWYAALMDYGAHLKRSGVRINGKSAHYVKQKAFKGSAREARGAVLKALMEGAQLEQKLLTLFGDERREQVRSALATLAREGMIRKDRRSYCVPGHEAHAPKAVLKGGRQSR